LVVVASIECEVRDLLTVDDLRDFSRCRIHRLAARLLDDDDLGELTDFEYNIDGES
jgi:hypothetical protein